MVHQIEAEAADLGMNGGAGRIPSGVCMLACAVYKWPQLHQTILKSYPSGPSDNPAHREYYTQWTTLPPGSARSCNERTTSWPCATQALSRGTAQ